MKKIKKAEPPEKTKACEPSNVAGAAVVLEEPIGVERRQAFLIANVKLFDFLQAQRVRLSNRGKVKKDGKSQKILHGELKTEIERQVNEPVKEWMKAQEKDVLKVIEDCITDFPIWTEHLSKIKGVGPSIAGHIMAAFDINKATTVSKMWAFAGLSPDSKLVKGEKSKFNTHLRTKLAGVLATSLMMAESEPYYSVYLARRKYREDNDWGTPSKNPVNKDKPKAGHQDRDARRYMVKRFIRDLWVAWRRLEGLPITEPWRAVTHEKTDTQERVA